MKRPNERTTGNGAVTLWFHAQRLSRAVPDRVRSAARRKALKRTLALTFGLVLSCAVGPWVSAQTPAVLDIRLYAGLTITGMVGTVYSIECVTDVAQTNEASAWRCLEFLQLPASPYFWADQSVPVMGRRFYRAVAMQPPTNMVFIPPGTFRMGSPTNEADRAFDEGPQTAVTISRGFWMGKYEVTQGEYLAVVGDNPSWFNGVRNNWQVPGTSIDYGIDLTRPVETVTWFDVTNYCGNLTHRERAAGRVLTNCVYRLPTEAEWEYACRAWTSTRLSYGDDPGYGSLTNYAWYCDNSEGHTHPVGQKPPNLWGLYDMHGNVWEICHGPCTGSLPGGISLDPPGSEPGQFWVIRGGCWTCWGGRGRGCRSAFRMAGEAGRGGWDQGFRVVLAPGQP